MNVATARNSRAFTLIELIVVIVILGILVAIGAFAYQSMIKATRVSAAEKTGYQLAKSISAASATLNKAPNALTTGVLVAPAASDLQAALAGDVTVVMTRTTGAQVVLPAVPGDTLSYFDANGCSTNIQLSATTVGATLKPVASSCP